jgi:general secretion pathway protein A
VILDPGLQVEDLLRQVLTDFGIVSDGDLPAAGPIPEVTRHQFVTALQQFLASLIPLQAHAVIMIDEAQRLNPRVLEEIRLLSNFETDEAKLLQIVLVGQPDLDEVLRRPTMQQLNQRVARRCELQPLSESEVGDYIERRLTVATSPATPGEAGPAPASTVRFSQEAVKAVYGISGGIPRVVNTLCDRALEVAYERKTRIVDPDSVLAAAERLQLDVPRVVNLQGAHRRTGLIAAAAAAVIVLAIGAGWWMGRPGESTPRGATNPQQSESPAGAGGSAAPGSGTAAPAGSAAGPETGASGSSPASSAAGPANVPGYASTAARTSAPGSAAPAGAFEIAVAAFRTESRAQEVADAVSALPVPASVRVDSTGSWYRVLAGPFPTREAALAAQDTLGRGGYADTRLTQLP